MNFFTNKDISPLILDKGLLCCRTHLYKLKLVSKKINNSIMNNINYYKVLNKLTENEAIKYKDLLIELSNNFYNLNYTLNNISSMNLSHFDSDSFSDNSDYESETE
jgi:hypothetical protein|tara:strand:+ start:65 stop:382 length:318 start_codon:yes stop_codon:yes gene_type:complete